MPEALQIAKHIAEALEATHEAGVIHCDLKPANDKVRPNGTLKVSTSVSPRLCLLKTPYALSRLMSPTMTDRRFRTRDS